MKLSGASDNPALVPDSNILFGGTGNLRSVAITPAPGANNQNSGDRGANITVTVSDPNGTSASASFLLNVISGNSLPAGLSMAI